jgi:Tn3 transposase DDE domain
MRDLSHADIGIGLDVVVGEFRRTASLTTKPTCRCKARLGALPEQTPLEFCECPKHVKNQRPCAVVASRASVRLRNPMPRTRRSSMVSINCFIERARRSSFHTINRIYRIIFEILPERVKYCAVDSQLPIFFPTKAEVMKNRDMRQRIHTVKRLDILPDPFIGVQAVDPAHEDRDQGHRPAPQRHHLPCDLDPFRPTGRPTLMRLKASIEAGAVVPSVIQRKLASAGGGNALSRALRALGRIERTLFTLQWLSDPVLRQRSHAGLNKGEASNALRRAVFFIAKGKSEIAPSKIRASVRRA